MKNTIFSRLPSEKYWQEQTYGDRKSMVGGKVQYSVHSTISPQDIPKNSDITALLSQSKTISELWLNWFENLLRGLDFV